MKTKKLIVIIFSAALGISFLFIGFGSYVGKNYVLKVGNQKISTLSFLEHMKTINQKMAFLIYQNKRSYFQKFNLLINMLMN